MIRNDMENKYIHGHSSLYAIIHAGAAHSGLARCWQQGLLMYYRPDQAQASVWIDEQVMRLSLCPGRHAMIMHARVFLTRHTLDHSCAAVILTPAST